ncbi:MAG: alpha/beta fold hydrolase [Gaiellales bacterium]
MSLPAAPAIRYGDHPDQVANLHLPAIGGGAWPCVVLIHGGFWRERWDRTLMTALARDLAARGLAAWNIEYRRVGQPGGGWPGTLADVAAAVDHLATLEEIDAARVATCGHSAGGQLALWAAGRRLLPPGAVGAAPRIVPRAAVSQAGVADLEAGAVAGLGAGAVQELLGGEPAELRERYAVASPAALLPLGVPQLLVHGDADDIVPPAQSENYADIATAAGDDVTVRVLAGVDHFAVVEPGAPAWRLAADWLGVQLTNDLQSDSNSAISQTCDIARRA